MIWVTDGWARNNINANTDAFTRAEGMHTEITASTETEACAKAHTQITISHAGTAMP